MRAPQIRRVSSRSPARQGISDLHKIFADILKIKRESALVTQNQLARGANMCVTSSTISPATLTMLSFRRSNSAPKKPMRISGRDRARQYFVVNADHAVAASALARLKFVENALHAISSTDEKILQGLKEAATLLDEYRQALTKLIENSKK